MTTPEQGCHYDSLTVDDRTYCYAPQSQFGLPHDAPYTIRALLDNTVARFGEVSPVLLEAMRNIRTGAGAALVPFSPARILLQDYTGVACLVDLVTLRDTVAERAARDGGAEGSPGLEPSVPVQLVVDHSISVDAYGSPIAIRTNAAMDYRRNSERYAFFRWCEKNFAQVSVVPPGQGIVHQVNLELLADVVSSTDGTLHLDSCVGTDSHTTMINGLGILGWGVGGIEAIAAALHQPLDILLPPVVGVELRGTPRPGITSTDIVLTVTERLREHGVVGKFVEFHGDGVSALTAPVRATISNMSPEFGSTCAVFPIDAQTIDYLSSTGRSEHHVHVVEAYARTQDLWGVRSCSYTEDLVIDLDEVVASVAGPSRPHERVDLALTKSRFQEQFPAPRSVTFRTESGADARIRDGSVVLAAITSCTNTSNPSVMLAAGLLAKKAVEAGLTVEPWVKTSMAPGSMIVTDYLDQAGLSPFLDKLGFNLVGYGCTTCAGNSGNLPEEVSRVIHGHEIAAAAVLSGNRNFEGRINPDARLSYLASPPLVVAYALAGTVDIDFDSEPIGHDESAGVYLRDIWPSDAEIAEAMRGALSSSMFTDRYADAYAGDERWQALSVPDSSRYTWDQASTYLRKAPYLDALELQPPKTTDIAGARVLAWLGDHITTDHISPAGAIKRSSPAGVYLTERAVEPRDFNSYGSRRGNHEVMVRGTFSNGRLRNRLVPDVEGGFTQLLPDGDVLDIYHAAMQYEQRQVPLIVIAGERYGAGSSRDWAAKGSALLGVRAVLAQSFERIHRSNLVGMGVLPLQFAEGENADILGLTGHETYDIVGLEGLDPAAPPLWLKVTADTVTFRVKLRLDTPLEATYYLHGGLMPFVARKTLGAEAENDVVSRSKREMSV